ncbi:hypothetical protein ACWC3Y_11010 [Streptomyces sp. NPDC001296]
MTAPTVPGLIVIVSLACWTVGWLCFAAAGITALATAIRRYRSARRNP